VTEQQETSEKIAYLARYDTLTGLPNRMMVIDALENALVAVRDGDGQCAFLMIDLDRFKAVNDTLGHPVGDQLLSQVAERLKVLMTPNSLCGRLGGDEFCVVLRRPTSVRWWRVWRRRSSRICPSPIMSTVTNCRSAHRSARPLARRRGSVPR
jgi:diguanylate cyclase (GGDEF)-like protein